MQGCKINVCGCVINSGLAARFLTSMEGPDSSNESPGTIEAPQVNQGVLNNVSKTSHN